MGNRAIIKAKGNNNKAVYLHWNGGRDSVEAFLKYCELRGFRGFEDDYGMARFVQVVSNYLGIDGLSIGITDCIESCGDNGVYIVKGWEIIGREDVYEEQYIYDLQEMLLEIDKNQPVKQQLGKEFLEAEIIERKDLIIGDTVYLENFGYGFKKFVVVGFGSDTYKNGLHVLNLPYVNNFLNNGTYEENANNYIRNEFVRVVRK